MMRLLNWILRLGDALGNKGISLFNLAFLVKGYTHICLLEAQQLLTKALLGNLAGSAQNTYKSKLLEIQRIIDFMMNHLNQRK